MGVSWTKEQAQVIHLRNRNILAVCGGRLRKDSGACRADHHETDSR